MNARPICHPDFQNITPINVFHKEMQPVSVVETEETFRNRHILFRRKAVLPKAEKATLRITADDYYKLYINGQFITQGPAASYPHSYFYNELDITPYLIEGENIFAVHTYYQGLINRVWVSGDRRQMLFFSLDIDDVTMLCSDEHWLCANHTGYSSCGLIGYETAFAECYDSRAPEVGFEKVDFDDTGWGYAAIAKYSDHVFKKQETDQLVLYEVPATVLAHSKNRIFVDFGQEAVGYLCANAKGHAGDEILLRYGEELNEDGTVRYQLRCNCLYEEKWILSGDWDTLNNYDYKAFRYAELILPEGVSVTDIRMRIRHYPFEERAVYRTDNEELKQILKLCSDTIKYGTQENFVDCPTREKGQYLGDVSIAARAQAVLTGRTDMIRKAIWDFCETAFVCDGLLAVSGSSFMQEIADYSLQLPATVIWVYRMDGDKGFLRKVEPYMTHLYQYFLKYENAAGLIEGVTDKWNLVDWPKNLRDDYDFPLTKPIGNGIHNVLNAFWCGFLDSMDEIYLSLGLPPTGKAERAKAAYIDAFYCKDTGLFTDAPGSRHSAIHSVVLPLLFEIGTSDEALKNRLVSEIAHKKLTAMGVYMAYFALAALIKHGEYTLAEALAVDSGCWLNMLAEGATTTLEAWGKDQKWNTSLFHPWATAPSIVFADGIPVY